MDKLNYSRREAAEALGISPSTLDRQRKLGKIPYTLIGGRILHNVEQINRLAQGRRRKAVQG